MRIVFSSYGSEEEQEDKFKKMFPTLPRRAQDYIIHLKEQYPIGDHVETQDFIESLPKPEGLTSLA